jgi:hypothetical protein
MRQTTDSFHLGTHGDRSPNYDNNSDFTYQLTNSNIFTNFQTGEVEMSYIAFPVDDDGFPMIPDDDKYIRAIVDFIAFCIARKMYLNEEMTREKFQWIEVESGWAMGSAHTRGSLQSLDEAETMKNAILRLIPTINQHADGFVYLGQGEERYIK